MKCAKCHNQVIKVIKKKKLIGYRCVDCACQVFVERES